MGGAASHLCPSFPSPALCTCDGLCLRTDGPCGGLGLGGRHCLLRHKLDCARGCHRRAGQLAAALLVSYKGIQVAELLLTDTADVDVRSQLYQDCGASGDSMGQRKNHILISDQCHGRRLTYMVMSFLLSWKPTPNSVVAAVSPDGSHGL